MKRRMKASKMRGSEILSTASEQKSWSQFPIMEKLTKAFHKRKKTNDAVRRLRGYYRMKCSFKLVCQGNEIKISKYGWRKQKTNRLTKFSQELQSQMAFSFSPTNNLTYFKVVIYCSYRVNVKQIQTLRLMSNLFSPNLGNHRYS